MGQAQSRLKCAVVPCAILALVACMTGCAGPRVEAKADSVLRAMSAALGGAEHLTIRGHSVLAGDDRRGPGPTDTAEAVVLVDRPNRLAQDIASGTGERRVYYDGASLTLLDVPGNAYATMAAPATIDALVATLEKTYGLSLPLADFFVSDPRGRVLGRVRHAAYIGEEDVGGVMCHHLAFDEENVVWELWVSVDRSLPVRMVALGQVMDGEPGLGMDFTEVDLAARHEASAFEFVPPEGATEVRIERAPAGR
jgi:hypothetical protein